MLETLLNIDYTPFILSFKLAAITTLILFFLCLPLAWYLSQTKSKFKPIIEAVTSLPIVLPPSVLGFYLLIALSQINLSFSFWGLVVGSIFYSLPFMVQPLQNGFESINRNILEASYICGKSKLETIFKVALPNMKPALLTALIITFAHTVGEFGVVLMIGGSIPNETKVASIAIYEFVEVMDYKNAHIYAAIMVVMSFLVLLSVYIFNHKESFKFKGLH